MIHGGNIDKISRQLKVPSHKLLDFSANLNPLGVPAELKDTLLESLKEIRYYPDPEYVQLRTAIARYHKVDLQTVFVGNGAVQLIFEIANALSYGHGLVLAPTFSEYEHALKRAHVQVHHYCLREENNFQLVMTDLIAYLHLHSEIKTIYLANPNNPTGNLITIDDLKKLVVFCNQNQRYLILDEAFINLVCTKNSSYGPFLNINDNVFIVYSATKFFAIPGLRLGYCLVKNPKLQKLLVAQIEPWSVNILAARFGAKMFQAKDYIQQTNQWFTKQQPLLYQQLKSLSVLKVYPSTTNFFLFQCSQLNLKNKLLDYKIMIRQCEDYYGLGPNYFRVALRNAAENKYLIKCLHQCLEKGK